MAFSTSTVESAEPSFVAARAPRGPSDRAVNADIAAVSALARDVYGRMGEAWMRSRNPGLGGKTPVDVIGEGRTPEVRDLLERIRDTVEA